LRKVIVEWLDSKVMHGWYDSQAFEGEVALCECVGFLYEDLPDMITLVMGKSDSEMVIEGLSIPRGCIKSIKELRSR
jgi:hypothetical protein